LARADIEIEDAVVILKAAAESVAGTDISVEWTGPNNKGDYITIVAKDTEDGKYAKYTRTSRGTPLKDRTPAEAGDCEIRYMAGQGGKVLARIPLRVTAAADE